MTFVLVRHGLTDYNERGLANGDSAQPVLLSADEAGTGTVSSG